jgi:hypothetical protein
MKIAKFVLRLLAFPFFAAIGFLYLLVLWGVYCVNFLRFGGETIAYTNKTKPKSIADVYLKVEDLLNSDKEVQASVASKAASSHPMTP